MIGLVLLAAIGATDGTKTSTAVVAGWVADCVAGRGALPPLARVQDAAVAALAIGPEGWAEGWAERARWRAALPQLRLRVGSERDVLVRDSLDGVDWARSGEGLGVTVGARWALGDLVLSDLEMRIQRERLARDAAMRLARERVTKIYFERVAVLVAHRIEPSPTLVVEAARLDGLLRALTGGRYPRPPEEGR